MRQGQRVYVIDDEPSVGCSVRFLLATLKLDCLNFPSAAAFLDRLQTLAPGCILLDVRMPGLGGMELQEELHRRGIEWPIIFMTGDADIPTVVQGLRRGAIEFISKPFSDEELLTALHKGFVQLREAT